MDDLGWTPDEKGSQGDWDPFGWAHFPQTQAQKIVFPTKIQNSKTPGPALGPPVRLPIGPVGSLLAHVGSAAWPKAYCITACDARGEPAVRHASSRRASLPREPGMVPWPF